MACPKFFKGIVPLLAVFGYAAAAQTAPPEAAFTGRKIASIRYAPDSQPYPLPTLDRLNPVKAGDIFDVARISDAIEKLYETGRFYAIDVNATLSGEEVIVEFQTEPSWFVGGVSVNKTPDPPNEGQLIAATRLELGQDFGDEYLFDATQGVLSQLRDNGFYKATVKPAFANDSITQQVNLRFDIDSGKRARFTAPSITGDSGLTAKQILHPSRWQRLWGLAGYKEVTEARVQSGLERIRYSFQKRDFLMAKVALDRLEYIEDENRVRPHLRIEQGPRIKIRAEGARLSRGQLRRLVPVFQERTVDRDLLNEGVRNITLHFQSQGFFDADVDFLDETAISAAEQTVLFRIDRGGRYKLVYVDVKGNEYFDAKTIRERLTITPATRIRYRNGRFSDELLRKDASAIEFLYRSNGFRDAKVEHRVERGYKGNETDVAAYLTITEGPQWFVESVEVTGVNLRDIEAVQRLLQTIEGQPYSEYGVITDRDSILNYYFNNGFPDASLEIKAEPVEGANRVNVKFDVIEGRRNFVRRVLVSGYRTTRPRLIYDRIPLDTGDPLSQSAIIDAQRQLYELGIFAKVDIAVQNPAGKERDKNVLYRLEEASRYSYTYGFGAQLARIGGGIGTFDAPAGAPGFSPRINFGVSRVNFMGLGHTVSVRTQLSNFQKRAVASYYAPQFTGNAKLNLNFTALYDNSRDVRTFEAERLESSIQLGQRMSRANTLQYRFTFRRVNINDTTLAIDPALIPLLSQPVRVGIASASFIQDKRDDPIDSRRGVYNTIDFGLASGYFGSQSNFLRLLVRNSSYHRIRKDLTFARLTTLGGMYSIMGNDASRDVPLPERFFSGGGATHRGFPDNQAGPRDLFTGFPVGGKALLMNAMELRFPLIGDTFGGVLYHDMGNVYRSLNKISFRTLQRDVQDFDYMVHAVGIGIRYRTPVGPVRFDIGFSPNSPKFFGFRGTRDQLLQGGGTRLVQRINQLQFHFSLGQTF